MKLSKNGRKTQKAIHRALMLGLPVAGLLLTAGCERSSHKTMTVKEVSEIENIQGRICMPPEKEKKRLMGGD